MTARGQAGTAADPVREFASAVLALALARRRSSQDDPSMLDDAVERVGVASDRFSASLAEPTVFSALVSFARLSLAEAQTLAVLLIAETSDLAQQLVVRLTGDAERTRVELGLLNELFEPPHARAMSVGPSSGLGRAALVEVRAVGPWSRHVVELSASVISALYGERSPDPALPYSARVVEAPLRSSGADLVVVSGPDAVRRREAALERVAGGRLLVTPLPVDEAAWAAVVREATMLDAVVCLELATSLPDIGRRWIDRATHLQWIVSTPTTIAADELPKRQAVECDSVAREPSDDEWAMALGADVPRTHRLTAEQLERVVPRFDANGRNLDAAVRRLVSSRLDTLTRHVRPSRGWDELVLPADQRELLASMVQRYLDAPKVYDHWGFTASPSRGLVMLFSGPSGTGKSLAAEVIAGALGLDLYRLDLSSVVSKYIGETEKNLDEIFEAAGAGNLVLFFDEADALFGKRSEVRDAHDRYANIEVSYLLQRLERYDGVVVLATNYEKNIDDAFVRRIHARIDFSLPSYEQRLAIWRQQLPPDAPVAADVDLPAVAERFELSGGSIRNAAITAAFIAAASGGEISMSHLVDAVARELRKQGRLIRREEFPEVFPGG